MTSSIGFYVKPKASFDEDDLFGNEEDNEEFDSQGYMYEVPYTSSSVDRSSIGSIPWAEDAIKINKMEWDKVEKMLCGMEPVANAEDDFSKEIIDWQKKFPQLLNKTKHNKELLIPELDIESLHSIGLTSDDETEEKSTLTRNHHTILQSTSKSSEEDSNLCQLMDNFTLKSVPFKLTEREANGARINKRKCSSTTSSYSLRSPPALIQQVPLVTNPTNRFRMPPILNVLDSRKKFRNLGQNKHTSFVQLTQIQQAKSAAVTQKQKSPSHYHIGHRSAWHVPFVANRFSNNRNSIILPSISTTHQAIHRHTKQPTTTSTNSEIATSNTTSSSSGSRPNLLRTNNGLVGFTTNASTQTNTSIATSGRSISAAVKYPRFTTFNALYLPYSVSKFHPFN